MLLERVCVLVEIYFQYNYNIHLKKSLKVSHIAQWLLRNVIRGLPWGSSGYDSVRPLQGAWVRSLVQELRSYKPHGVEKKKKVGRKERKKKKCSGSHVSYRFFSASLFVNF